MQTNEWVTCPIVVDERGGDIEYANVITLGGAFNIRFERRTHNYNSVVGWNATGPLSTGSVGTYKYEWASGSDYLSTSTSHDASYAIELYLNPNSGVSGYRVDEK